MIAALIAAWWWACRWTGAYVLGCAAIVLAVVGIGLLRAFWRDWRASKHQCRYCFVPLVPQPYRPWAPKLCGLCYAAWVSRRYRLPREVMG